jgi:hypothetical protein
MSWLTQLLARRPFKVVNGKGNRSQPADKAWGIRNFVIIDPTGFLWRIGQNGDVVRDCERQIAENFPPIKKEPAAG